MTAARCNIQDYNSILYTPIKLHNVNKWNSIKMPACQCEMSYHLRDTFTAISATHNSYFLTNNNETNCKYRLWKYADISVVSSSQYSIRIHPRVMWEIWKWKITFHSMWNRNIQVIQIIFSWQQLRISYNSSCVCINIHRK